MKTEFTEAQLRDPDMARSDQILRACVHCGFCTATCPTYQALGDELDSPRGRIYLIKGMLENERVPADSHLCRGSAGTYNLIQPAISKQLKDRNVRTLKARAPDVIATGNIGCMMQIGGGTQVPVVHTVELLDWATGGPVPPALTEAETPPPDLRATP